jgi:hypothetical protein
MPDNTEKANCSKIEHVLYTFLGCIPMIVITFIMSYILYLDYVGNGYSFLKKDQFLSHIEKFEYEASLECVENKVKDSANLGGNFAPKSCFRYYSDFLISEEEADVLFK